MSFKYSFKLSNQTKLIERWDEAEVAKVYREYLKRIFMAVPPKSVKQQKITVKRKGYEN